MINSKYVTSHNRPNPLNRKTLERFFVFLHRRIFFRGPNTQKLEIPFFRCVTKKSRFNRGLLNFCNTFLCLHCICNTGFFSVLSTVPTRCSRKPKACVGCVCFFSVLDIFRPKLRPDLCRLSQIGTGQPDHATPPPSIFSARFIGGG